jgi:hypothetical protein
MLREQQPTFSMRCTAGESCTPHSDQHSFSTTGDSISLVTRVTPTSVPRGKLGESISWGEQGRLSLQYRAMCLLFGFCFKWYILCVRTIRTFENCMSW